MTMRALEAVETLRADRVDAGVLHVPTIKPLDEATILKEAGRAGRMVVVAENHTMIGGLGEAVAGLLLRSGITPTFRQIALPDEFLDAGALPTLHERYGISTEAMVRRIKAWQAQCGLARVANGQLGSGRASAVWLDMPRIVDSGVIRQSRWRRQSAIRLTRPTADSARPMTHAARSPTQPAPASGGGCGGAVVRHPRPRRARGRVRVQAGHWPGPDASGQPPRGRRR